ncbi:MAG: class I SAM-dependent methyltransferase [Acidimicrobiales bacterium]|nr:class I SAM-dependent methyltransferase [Acidimicrobiales bacterium]
MDDQREDHEKSHLGTVPPNLSAASRRPGASVFGAFQSQFLMTGLADTVATAAGGVLTEAPLIIDCGSGGGRLSEALLDRLPEAGLRIVLLDVDHGAVAEGVGRMRDRIVAGLCADLEVLPFRRRCGAVFMLSHVLYYTRDRETLLQRLLFECASSWVVAVVRDRECVTARLWRHVTGGGRRATDSVWLRDFIERDPRIEAAVVENITDARGILTDLPEFLVDARSAPKTSAFVEATVYRSPLVDQVLYDQAVEFFSSSSDFLIREHVYVLNSAEVLK